jgi:hypothetical protein
MPPWLEKLIGPKASGTPALGERLRDYPPFTPLHLGQKLSKAEAEANLAQLVEAVPERLKIVVAFLQQEKLDPRPALSQNDPRPFLAALWEWGRLTWKTAPQPWRSDRSWRESRRDRDDILLSLLTDIGIVLAEIIRGFRADYRWAMVDGRDDRSASYYRQPVLKVDAPRPQDEPPYKVFDLIDVVVHNCTLADRPRASDRNEMSYVVSECVLGGYEWAWKGLTVAPPTQSWETFLAERAADAP